MSTSPITIIQLTPAEWELYKALRLETLREEPQAFNSKLEEVSAYPDLYWQEALADPNDIYAFAKCNAHIVGVMKLSLSEKGEAENVAVIHGAYVSRDYRGLGIGKSLLSFLINSVKKNNGINVLKLWVKESQTSARHLYEKEGFKFVERAGEHTLILEKRL